MDFCKACIEGDLETVEECLYDGFNIEAKITNSNALYFAVSEGRLNVVEYFVKHGAIINNKKLLDIAAINGHLGVVKCLVENDCGDDIQHALSWAKRKSHLDVANYLSEKAA